MQRLLHHVNLYVCSVCWWSSHRNMAGCVGKVCILLRGGDSRCQAEGRLLCHGSRESRRAGRWEHDSCMHDLWIYIQRTVRRCEKAQRSLGQEEFGAWVSILNLCTLRLSKYKTTAGGHDPATQSCPRISITATGYISVNVLNRGWLMLSCRWNVPIHVDAASGGFVAPFIYPEIEWDFRLKWVKSINASGHKYGLVYPGIGWVIWRSKEELPEELIFHINYLGADQPTFTLNFSKGIHHHTYSHSHRFTLLTVHIKTILTFNQTVRRSILRQMSHLLSWWLCRIKSDHRAILSIHSSRFRGTYRINLFPGPCDSYH